MAGGKWIEPAYDHWGELTRESFLEIMQDFERYCAETILILNKNGQAVPMVLNEAQKEVAEQIIPLAFKGIPIPVILIIHKFRQGGISTVLAVIEKYILSRRRNTSAVHLFPTDKLAKEFFEQKFLPIMQGSHPSFLPLANYVVSPIPKVRFVEFLGKKVDSFLKIGGALSKASGRSGTNQIVIFDEYAFYEKVSQLEKGVLATMPKTGFTLTVYVSTANGVNHFYDAIKNAKKNGAKTVEIFLGWHMLSEYEMEPYGRLADLDNLELTDYEMFMMDIFEKQGYPMESWLRKIQFYNYVLETEAKGDQQMMFSEYPTVPEESFEASGKPVFPPSILLRELDRASKLDYLMVEPVVKEVNGVRQVVLESVPRAGVRIYKKPIQGRKYIMGVDPSMGYEDGDFLAGVVLDYESMEEVCSFKDKMEQSEFAELAVSIAKHYNNAMIVPERNMGSTFIEWLRLLNYYRVYMDPIGRGRPMFGIHMTRPVKREAINRFRFLLLNGIYKPNDVEFLDDALHFAWKATQSGVYEKAVAVGSDENNVPYHDDTVMARLTLISALDMRRWRNYAQEENRRQV